MRRQLPLPRRAGPPQLAVLALLSLVLFSVGCRRGDRGAAQPAAEDGDPTTVDVAGRELTLHLLYPGRGELLTAEQRTITAPGLREELVRLVLQELFAGPTDPALERPFPPSVTVSSVFVSEGGIAYVDLGSPELADPAAAGSLAELLEVYSVVDSVLVNVPSLEGVVLLWNGVQRPTFAGHLDTSRPLVLKGDLIRGRGTLDRTNDEPTDP
jgi:hypothetical protein